MKPEVETAQSAQDQSPYGLVSCILLLLAAGVFVKAAPVLQIPHLFH